MGLAIVALRNAFRSLNGSLLLDSNDAAHLPAALGAQLDLVRR
jgi:hypothetical protein